MDISAINRAKVRKRWERVHKIEKEYIAKNREKTRHLKARIHGYLCGDGSVSLRREKNGKLHCEIRFYPDHKGMVDSFIGAFKSVYGRTPHTKKLKNHFKVSITSIVVVKDLLREVHLAVWTGAFQNG